MGLYMGHFLNFVPQNCRIVFFLIKEIKLIVHCVSFIFLLLSDTIKTPFCTYYKNNNNNKKITKAAFTN